MTDLEQQLMKQCLADTSSKRAKLYGLALLRAIDTPRVVAHALGISKDQRHYIQAFRPLYQDYAYIFTDETHQWLRPDIRDFFRQHLLARRNEVEISKIITRVLENQQRRLHKLEEILAYQDLRTKLRDEEWSEAFLDLFEAQFWADSSSGVSYAIPFLLAASLYHPHLVQEMVTISSFFIDEIATPQRSWWFIVDPKVRFFRTCRAH